MSDPSTRYAPLSDPMQPHCIASDETYEEQNDQFQEWHKECETIMNELLQESIKYDQHTKYAYTYFKMIHPIYQRYLQGRCEKVFDALSADDWTLYSDNLLFEFYDYIGLQYWLSYKQFPCNLDIATKMKDFLITTHPMVSTMVFMQTMQEKHPFAYTICIRESSCARCGSCGTCEKDSLCCYQCGCDYYR